MLVGFFVSMALGKVSFEGLGAAPWVAIVEPMHFGMPIFDPVSIATMCLVMIVVMVESLGMFLALSDLTGRRVMRNDLTRGLRTDGLGTLIAGFSTPFRILHSRKTLVWLALPGSRVAGSACWVA